MSNGFTLVSRLSMMRIMARGGRRQRQLHPITAPGYPTAIINVPD
jgi:hypothetical protein